VFMRFSCLKHPEARVQRSDNGQIPTMEVQADGWIDVKVDELYCSVEEVHARGSIIIEFLPDKTDTICFAGGTKVTAWGREG